MELYEAINKRRTMRQFLETEVDFEVIKRINRNNQSVELSQGKTNG